MAEPLPPIPQTGILPPSLSAAEQARLLSLPAEGEDMDPFANDTRADVRLLGRLALRTGACEYRFALGDRCARDILGPAQTLCVSDCTKALLAYQGARHATDRADLRQIAADACQRLQGWVMEAALAWPVPRNLAVALWMASPDPQCAYRSDPAIDPVAVRQLLERYEDAITATIEDRPADPRTGPLGLALEEAGSGLRETTSLPAVTFDHDVDPEPAPDARPLSGYLEREPILATAEMDQPAPGGYRLTNTMETVEAQRVDLSALLAEVALTERTSGAEFDPGAMIDDQFEVMQVKSGGMGVVYLCYDHSRARAVAIKSYQQRLLDNPRAVERFHREALTWVRLEKHPNIVQALLVKQINDRPHILLEHVGGVEHLGVELRDWLAHGPVQVALALRFAIDIARGMCHATARIPGLVHRDLKPGNVLITHDEIAKITDFGLVQALDPAAGNGQGPGMDDGAPAHLTRVGVVVGTPPYVSPEQCQGLAIDVRSDIYAFGCILFEMLTGRQLFDADTVDAWMEAHVHRQPGFPVDVQQELPPALVDFTLACLAKSPGDRPSHWAEALAAVEAIYSDGYGAVPAGPASGIALEARELMDQGYSLTELGRLPEAIAAYDRALDLQPDNAWIWARKARALRLASQDQAALAAYDRALALDGQYGWAWNGRGIVLERLGRQEEATESFHRATESQPGDVWNWYNLGANLAATHRPQEALDAIAAALAIDPGHAQSLAQLGQILRTERRYEEAEAAYRQALEADPSYAWAHNGLGIVLEAQNQTRDAMLAYKRATYFQPEIAWHWHNLSQTLGDLGQYGEALMAAQQATRIAPDNTECWAQRGAMERYLGHYERAIDAYERAIALNPDFHWATNGLGLVHERKGDTATALLYYASAIDLDPQVAMYWYNLANAQNRLGKRPEALAAIGRALALEPGRARNHVLHSRILRAIDRLPEALAAAQAAANTEPGYAVAWYELGLNRSIDGDLAGALAAYEQAAEIEPETVRYLYQLADTLTALQRPQQALEILERALAFEKRSAHIWAKHGQALRLTGQAARAIHSYTRAIELEPAFAWAWCGMGLAHKMLDQHRDAVECFEHATQLDGSDAWYWYNLAEERFAEGSLDAALAALDSALAINPDHAESHAKRGQILRRQRRMEDAVAAYDRAIAAQPDFDWAWDGRGLALKALGRHKEALADFERAIQINDRSIWHRINKTTLLLEMGQLQDAQATIEAALNHAPDSATVWARLGQVQRRRRRYPEAIASYQQAVRLEPAYAWAWNGLGLCQLRSGLKEAALASFQQAVALEPRGDVWFHHNLADALHALGRDDEALGAIEGALALLPGHKPSWRLKGEIRKGMGHRDGPQPGR
jgi:tetratricopeptide (TPR) repeat protein/tRNA A-37 threonylcarbamoyl transferase component Bud32